MAPIPVVVAQLFASSLVVFDATSRIATSSICILLAMGRWKANPRGAERGTHLRPRAAQAPGSSIGDVGPVAVPLAGARSIRPQLRRPASPAYLKGRGSNGNIAGNAAYRVGDPERRPLLQAWLRPSGCGRRCRRGRQ